MDTCGGVELGAVLDDVPGRARGLRVDRHRVLGPEVPVALYRQAPAQADCGDLGEARVPELRRAEAEVGEAEQRVAVLRVELVEEPRRRPAGVEELEVMNSYS